MCFIHAEVHSTGMKRMNLVLDGELLNQVTRLRCTTTLHHCRSIQ
jgi:hypothetical protein